MHVLYDENGNLIPHGAGHDHDHHHDHDHDHDHEHCHEHHHHDEDCNGCGACHTPEAETIALMSYMVDHNKHHAMELVEMSKKLRELGKNDAAEQIDKAVAEFESGNLRLGLALSLLKA